MLRGHPLVRRSTLREARQPLPWPRGIGHALVDRMLESWQAGHMKTTIDLPEDLVREMKFRAVREGRKLREVAAEVFRRGLAAPETTIQPGARRRIQLPIIPAPAGARPFELSGDRLLELEKEADVTGRNR